MDLHKQQWPESLVRGTNALAVMRSRIYAVSAFGGRWLHACRAKLSTEKPSLGSRSGLDGLNTFLLGVIGRFCHNGKS